MFKRAAYKILRDRLLERRRFIQVLTGSRQADLNARQRKNSEHGIKHKPIPLIGED